MSCIPSVKGSYGDSNREWDDDSDGDGAMVRRKIKLDMLSSFPFLNW